MTPSPVSARTQTTPLRVLKPTRGWRALNPHELWAYRELFLVIIERDLRVRYQQSILGGLWALVQPLSSMVVLTLVFGYAAKLPSDGIPYPVFVFAGLLPWQLFSTTVARSSQSLVSASHVISKVYFPRLLVPVSAIGVALIDFLIALVILFVLMLVYGVELRWQLAFLPLLLAGLLMLAIGIGVLLSGAAARYRDLQHVVPFALQLWMFASPVVYPPSLVPEAYRWLVFLNPVAGYIDGMRAAALGTPYDLSALGIAFASSVLAALLGAVAFARVERRIADVL